MISPFVHPGTLSAAGSLLRACLLVLVFSCAMSSNGNGQARRAMLVGINTYAPPEDADASVTRKWRDLEGAANDAEAMRAILSDRFAFEDIHVLTNRDATRDAILRGIKDWLVEPSSPGDIVVFYYAGHGSQARNTASKEADGMDETIVPADAWQGSPDIRDKELRDAFNELLSRGVVVTLIFDSCHSGSITRGLPSGRSRYIEPSPVVVSDASDPPKPADRGALIISASQDDEVARELSDEYGNSRGAFTWALSRAIESYSPNESAEQLFLRARAILRSTGATQEPVISGQTERRNQSFLGTTVASGRAAVPVIDVEDDGTILLQGGIATGLRPGASLVQYGSDSTVVARLEVIDSDGLSQSRAEMVDGNDLPKPGEVFEIDKWVTSAGSPLRLFIPDYPGSYDALRAWLDEIATLHSSEKLVLVEDPTTMPPDLFLFWQSDRWVLTDASGAVVPMTGNPSAAEIESAVLDQGAEHPRLFICVPPFDEFLTRLRSRFESLDGSVVVTDNPSEADYLLAGRDGSDEIEYAWILREATAGPKQSPAPDRSDWRGATASKLFSAAILGRDVSKLNVIWGWLNLQGPPDDGTFPYGFGGFENVADGTRRYAGDTLLVGERYRAVLKTTFAELEKARVKAMSANAQRRFVYFFVMDRSGNGYLLYPAIEYGNVENDVALFTDLQTEIRIPGADGVLFEVSEPVGIDSFFIVTTAQPIPQPGVFNFEGIRTRGPATGEQTDLSRLFYNLGSGTRGARQPVPTSWSLDRITVRSMPASE